jgi:FkbM family methyltransferase
MPPYGTNWLADLKRYSPSEISLILDVGANIGQTCIELTNYFPNGMIHDFEPVTDSYNQLVRTTQPFANIKTHKLGIGSDNVTTSIWLKSDDQQNSLSPKLNTPSDRQETITVITLDSFARENNIHRIGLLKSDTEGYDLEVIKGAHTLLDLGLVDFVLTEVGIPKSDIYHTNLFDVTEQLMRYNFELMGIYDRLYHDLRPRMQYYCNAQGDCAMLGNMRNLGTAF